MYSERIEALINAALIDGKLTEKEKQILYKNAEAEGIDLDEFEMILDARLVELEKAKEETMKSAPKSNKLGDVRKCPACGALVNSFHRKCQECGYVFENIQVCTSVAQLSDRLMKAKTEKSLKSVISSFPVPSTKGDLMEFITLLRPYIYKSDTTLIGLGKEPNSHWGSKYDAYLLNQAYLLKYKECLEKIKIYFPTDETLNQYVTELHEAEKRTIKKQKYETLLEDFGGPILIIGVVSVLAGVSIAEYIAYLNDFNIWGYIGYFILGGFIGLLIGYLLALVLYLMIKRKVAKI